ncbi:MAG: HYR domain-containing protein, partial [Saprospiraceae bacterium]
TFTNDAMLATPATPVLVSVAADCIMDGSTTISSYASNLTYTFDPAGPSAVAGGVITGAVLDQAYSVAATNADGCISASATFTNDAIEVSPPVLANIPADISITAPMGSCGAIVSWTAPTASDNCPGVILTSTHNSGETFPAGTTQVVYTATDAEGLVATGMFNIEVLDLESPEVTCPATISVFAAVGETTAEVTIPLPTVSDNCSGFTVVNSFNTNGIDASDDYPLGTTTVTYTVTDASGNTSICMFDVTVEVASEVFVSPVVFLQGALTGGAGGLMRDDLRVLEFIPEVEPYTALANFNHIGGGGEIVLPSVLATTGSDAIVDWVFVELREFSATFPVVATRAALLQRDGDVVDVDGVSPVKFTGVSADNYHVSVRHRNHLGVMAATPFALSSTTTTVNLSTETSFGSFAQTQVSGINAMWSGNTSSDSQIVYSGPGNDYSPILFGVLSSPGNASSFSLSYIAPGYAAADANMDGNTILSGPGNDAAIVFFNVLQYPLNGTFSLSYIIAEQLP